MRLDSSKGKVHYDIGLDPFLAKGQSVQWTIQAAVMIFILILHKLKMFYLISIANHLNLVYLNQIGDNGCGWFTWQMGERKTN